MPIIEVFGVLGKNDTATTADNPSFRCCAPSGYGRKCHGSQGCGRFFDISHLHTLNLYIIFTKNPNHIWVDKQIVRLSLKSFFNEI